MHRKYSFICIDDNDIITRVNMRSKGWFIFTAKNFSNLGCETADRLAFPVRDGIAVMLENEARSVDPDAIVPPPVFPAPAPNAPDTP